MRIPIIRLLMLTVLGALAGCETPAPPEAPERPAPRLSDVDTDVEFTLRKLYISAPEIRPLVRQSDAVLVFPAMTAALDGSGIFTGDGTLRRAGLPAGHYRSAGSEFNLPASLESFAYVLVFMPGTAPPQLDQPGGLAIGQIPDLVMVNPGRTRGLDTARKRGAIYGFVLRDKTLLPDVRLDRAKIIKQ